MVSKDVLEKIDYLIENYLPPWFKEEFYERIYRFEIQEDTDLVKEFLKLIYLHFIQPAKFMIQTLKNLREVNRDITTGKIELPEGQILIEEDKAIIFTKSISYDDIEKFITDFERLLVELGLVGDLARLGKW